MGYQDTTAITMTSITVTITDVTITAVNIIITYILCCIVVRGDAWPLLLSPCNSIIITSPFHVVKAQDLLFVHAPRCSTAALWQRYDVFSHGILF